MSLLGDPRALERVATLAGAVTAVVTLVFLSSLLASLLGLAGILLGDLLLLCFVVALLAVDRGGPSRVRRWLRPVPPLAWLGVLLMALGLAVLATAWLAVEQSLWPVPGAMREAWKAIAVEAEGRPLLAFLALALLPAAGEELLFRGVVLGSLEARMGSRRAVGLSALLFGVFHLSPHRLVTQTLLGLCLGLLAVRTGSLVAPVLLHMTYNVAILQGGELLLEHSVSPLSVAAAAVLLVAGFRLIPSRGGRPNCLHNLGSQEISDRETAVKD